ncbi:MAG: hypothetical protein COS24_02150 [Candidatus Nealsonbacteria bacterium CG02_land_8_20_14_3_00_34_20]|uniref:DUF6938 domain-containing protein n=1 Tax=Candidatus Nealsonbacteria bacterium CG02_land_8_20_14_3_00_34_20 TaxID=1974698 RepID=A0A2M7DAI4_9BACT|nr:MAG: hypothetical protein COS24_02150 [Candidatus Nealsonbacteria bacterium CG02_land_8_20_14_3_00_34_20]
MNQEFKDAKRNNPAVSGYDSKAWIVSVNMGYGHQRTAYPLKDLAFLGKVINANDYLGIPEKDRKIWKGVQKSYEFISRLKRVPLLGNLAFSIFDAFQKILTFYPERDLSQPNFTLKQIYSALKNGWGEDLVERLESNPLPLISTFFTPAFMAEFFNYPGPVFLVVCDADIARTWAPLNPKISKIKYFAPTQRVVKRLELYGVKKENIILSGYPLPQENISANLQAGGLEILKKDLKYRLLNLDPQKKYFEKYKILIEKHLGILPKSSDHPLTIMFAVGGAGAQKEIGVKILKSLSRKIKARQVKVILAAGTKEKVKEYFKKNIEKLGLNESIEILFEKNIESYFQKFNQALRKTDILWTKPSELSFYSALGLPIIIAPQIGSQEEFNKRWLLRSGFGIFQENPNYTDQWLFDWLEQGYLAEAAMQAFIEGEKLGTFNIQKTISNLCCG